MQKSSCSKHRDIELSFAEVEGYDYVNEISFTYDVEFCSKCFDEHASSGEPVQNNIVFDDFTTKIQPEELTPWEI
tara:strand:+ start:78 stop:302 length:225 start_codon:yes stop_codon:yes gene_type:complete